MKKSICTIVLFTSLFSLIQPAEKIKIARVEDTNRFVTGDGRVITLSNVATISINDSLYARQRFAHQTFDQVRAKLLFRWYDMQIVQSPDSTARVLLWRSLPLGQESINKYFLRNGWGLYVPEPPTDYADEFQQAAATAAAKKLGLHNPARFEPIVVPAYGVWLNAGLGGGGLVGRLHYRELTQCARIDLSLNVRRKSFIWTGGIEGAGVFMEAGYGAESLHFLVGKSFYHKSTESVLSIGPNLNRWVHNTESERGIIHSDWYPGLQFKAQIFAHLPISLGLGLSADANINKEISYLTFSLNVLCGAWFGEEKRR